jgi:hypothetical protein
MCACRSVGEDQWTGLYPILVEAISMAMTGHSFPRMQCLSCVNVVVWEWFIDVGVTEFSVKSQRPPTQLFLLIHPLPHKNMLHWHLCLSLSYICHDLRSGICRRRNLDDLFSLLRTYFRQCVFLRTGSLPQQCFSWLILWQLALLDIILPSSNYISLIIFLVMRCFHNCPWAWVLKRCLLQDRMLACCLSY